jgi:glyceraldehyde-3-phosphate dehydrogenase/erythrose-4-phosphate dehydrogenase
MQRRVKVVMNCIVIERNTLQLIHSFLQQIRVYDQPHKDFTHCAQARWYRFLPTGAAKVSKSLPGEVVAAVMTTFLLFLMVLWPTLRNVKRCSHHEINAAFKTTAQTNLKGIPGLYWGSYCFSGCCGNQNSCMEQHQASLGNRQTKW